MDTASSSVHCVDSAPLLPAGPGPAGHRRRLLEGYVERIRCAVDVAESVRLLEQALRDPDAGPGERQRRRAAGRELQALRAELQMTSALLKEDPLTGLLNPRGLAGAFEREAARARRQAAPIAMIALDLDDFERLNAPRCHGAGEQALIHLGAVLAAAVRPGDLTARLEAGTFLAVLAEARLEEARLCAVRLQAALAAAPLQWGGDRYALTFSAGVTQYRAGEGLERCVQRAGAALQGARRSGRNRVRTGG